MSVVRPFTGPRDMDPIVIAFACNERYFPGLYCAVASALSNMEAATELDLSLLDGGLSERSKDVLSRLIDRRGKRARLKFVTIDQSTFSKATLGPGRSHMAYCRILLPQLLDTDRLIYLDCDVLVFRDLSPLFDFEFSPGKLLAAVPDSETSSLAQDSLIVSKAMKVPPQGAYFNSGVMLMNLDELRRNHFSERAVEFLNRWRGNYRFWDQSAINFLLHGQIDTLPEYWNRPSWRFNQQQNNHLDCVLHYTSSAPWLGETRGPAQVLFERFAEETELPINRQSPDFKRSVRRQFRRAVLAPLRALAFSIASLFYRVFGRMEKSAAYSKVARYWFDYIRNAVRRRRLYRRRAEQIRAMRFQLGGFQSPK